MSKLTFTPATADKFEAMIADAAITMAPVTPGADISAPAPYTFDLR